MFVKDSPLAEKVKQRAERDHDGKVSAYVRSVVVQDLDADQSGKISPSVMIDLTRRLCGELTAESMAHALEGKDQRHELQTLLHNYAVEFETRQLKAADDAGSYGVKVPKQETPAKKKKTA